MDKSEYEIQHFGFSALQITHERNYMLRKTLSNVLESMLSKLNTSTETSRLLRQQKDAVINACMRSFEAQLQSMATLDAKAFSIPQHVLLTADFEHAKGYTEQDEHEVDAELAALKQLFLENSIMIASLKLENSRYDAIAPLLSEEVKVHAQIQATSKAADLQKLQTLVDNAKEFTNFYK